MICSLCVRVIWPWDDVYIFKTKPYHVHCGRIAEKLHELEIRIKILES